MDQPTLCLSLLRDLLDHSDQLSRESDNSLLELLRTLESVSRLASLMALTVAAEADRRGVPSQHSCSSLGVFLRRLLRLSPGESAERARMARALTESIDESTGTRYPPVLPATATALRTGELDLGHVRVIARTLAALPLTLPDQVRRDAEAFLTEQASQLDPHQLTAVARTLRTRLDQDGTLREEQDAVEQRELHITRDRRGRTRIRGVLDAEAGAALQTAIHTLASPGPAADGRTDPRGPARRRADALLGLAHHALDGGGLTSGVGERPHLSVTIGFTQLRDVAGTGTLERGDPITAQSVRRIACDAQVIPAVLNATGEPLDIGRASPTVPEPIRRALAVRDGGCAFPGCDRSPSWCNAHHIRHWVEGGDTALRNLVLLCGPHHRAVHHDGWQVRVVHGRAEFVPPRWVDPTRRPRRNAGPHDFSRFDAAS
ncbi:HNH endonuclease signature motif containing protein [Goodfellowiella coeruleoviolacea]|uniref:HNH nuclease domain-containing protein n=1 Tax=Goodfellowiella coeruleoviolacea TaxID=334858 RepID=A0AAE3KIL8_9PSEU|nr:HNH endonuclease signature motif containing protein [Goodfellowiella coeruleoviolacea]MCP2169401.1 protein of unknown function (DUF222) [Goodfellowiella coeruleoviolacea]